MNKTNNTTAPAFLHPLQIGPVKLDNNIALAPMAGTTDVVFRKICRSLGAGLTVTELASARGIVHAPGLHRNFRYLEIDPVEKPVAIQLFGADPDDFRKAVATILEHPLLGQCSMIDLNMGCPVAKVVKSGEGSALMKTPDLAARIIETCVDVASRYDKPVTVKFRKGWDAEAVNAVPFARMCQQAGASALTIHGRTREQMYGGQADWDIIAEVKAAVRIPVFGNGDVHSPATAAMLFIRTKVDGIMIGRAAQGNPWIFKEICHPGCTGPDVYARKETILTHLDGMIQRLGEPVAVREMRKHLACYLKGTRGATACKVKAMQVVSRLQIQAILEEWYNMSTNSCENT